MHQSGYNDGLLLTICLQIEAPTASIRPNYVLAPPPPAPRPTSPQPTLPTSTVPFKEVTESLLIYRDLQSDGHPLLNLIEKSFLVLNFTRPTLTSSCWLCYDTSPPYYEGIATTTSVNQIVKDDSCRWRSWSSLALQHVSGQGLCMFSVPPDKQFLCNHTHSTQTNRDRFLIPPEDEDGW